MATGAAQAAANSYGYRYTEGDGGSGTGYGYSTTFDMSKCRLKIQHNLTNIARVV